ncbi:MAG: hypothetical protein C0478_15370 [Planctomyces sp.]|nr:hypothetical protein [Planctomyces sp.]
MPTKSGAAKPNVSSAQSLPPKKVARRAVSPATDLVSSQEVVPQASENDSPLVKSERSQLLLRATAVWDLPLFFIPNADFGTPALDAEFLSEGPQPLREPRRIRQPEGLPAYLGSLYETPLLTPAQEVHAFRKYNCIKYKASTLRDSLNSARPSKSKLDEIERLAAWAAQVRDGIVRANLRLVVANARHFADADHTFDDLVSDGNLSLVQAVEKFDYSRGFRFSTYATHAIRRTFFRRMSRKVREKSRVSYATQELLQEAPFVAQEEGVSLSQFELYQTLIERMSERLNERELVILRARFSLEALGEVPTLQVLAADLGICKERVRQLQNRAIEKLRDLATEIRAENPVDQFFSE